ncbi:alpha/beta hydrolase [Saccharicrinis sp. FJH62]|uniref:alpha/beta hydrolase n=1 Tax=Saccharicrinis sp. FJH62 TaxID=3344657 RepID=UPI0035D4E321
MKTRFVLIVMLVVSTTVFAQTKDYSLLTNIPYYEHQDTMKDAYKKERCVLDVYYPKDMKGSPVVVWFHGGGLEFGHKEIPEGLKNKGIAVIGVNYRLSPKAKSPAYVEDAAAAVSWAFQHIAEYGGDPELIFVSGHSAGGYLTSMVGLDKRWLAKFNVDANDIAGLIPLSGQCITHFTIRKEQGIPSTEPIIDDMAPVNHVRADAPPILLITGDRDKDMPARYAENNYMLTMLKVVGHQDARLFELGGYTHMMVEPALPLLLEEVNRIKTLKGKV